MGNGLFALFVTTAPAGNRAGWRPGQKSAARLRRPAASACTSYVSCRGGHVSVHYTAHGWTFPRSTREQRDTRRNQTVFGIEGVGPSRPTLGSPAGGRSGLWPGGRGPAFGDVRRPSWAGCWIAMSDWGEWSPVTGRSPWRWAGARSPAA